MIRLDGKDISIGDEPRALTTPTHQIMPQPHPISTSFANPKPAYLPCTVAPSRGAPQSLTRERQHPAREVIVEQRSQVPPGVDTLGAPTAARWLP